MKLSALVIALASSFQASAWSFAQNDRQVSFSNGWSASELHAADLFTPLEDLSAVSESRFTTLSHPTFPKHSVRVKRTKFCDGTVRAYTGYIDIEARHLFFYFFESRNDPDKDDVILWTNGGPGASSSTGLFMELGPCRMTSSNETKYHPQSWNSRANIFFIDQPVGAGFSYAEHGETVRTTEEAAVDVAAFVYVFFEHFTKFKGRKLHLAGESYGGRYLPLFASYIYDQNEKLKEEGLTPINLASVMIGNGATHYAYLIESYYDMACTATSGAPPILGVQTCVRMKQAQIRCSKWMKKSCVDIFDELGCQAAVSFCNEELVTPVWGSGWNPYDISQKCEGDIEDTVCYPIMGTIADYLNQPDVRRLIGVDSFFNTRNISFYSRKVNADFALSLDEYRPTYVSVAALLEHGIKVLVYVGKTDWICNYIGNERWVRELDWSGNEGFARAKVREWSAHGHGHGSSDGIAHKKAGEVKSFGGLTFLTIDGAGHMAPYNKPDESLWMVNSWLNGDL